MFEDQPSVVIVDDDEGSRCALASFVSSYNLRVLQACNGEEALFVLQKDPSPRLILLDLEMPIMDGYEFLLRKQEDVEIAHVPVAVITATGKSASKNLPVIKKPCDPQKIALLLRYYCGLERPS